MPTFTVNIPGGRIGSFLAGAAVASVVGGTAVAITSPDFTYSVVKRGHYSIAPGAMIPRSHLNTYVIQSTELAGSDCYSTGVNLPQGASIQSITTWYKSNASSDLQVFAYRHNLPTGNAQLLATGTVPDDSNTRKPVTHNTLVALRIVDNTIFDYSYWVCLGTGTPFYGARINYTYKTAGD